MASKRRESDFYKKTGLPHGNFAILVTAYRLPEKIFIYFYM
jgi:hypothetical protein